MGVLAHGELCCLETGRKEARAKYVGTTVFLHITALLLKICSVIQLAIWPARALEVFRTSQNICHADIPVCRLREAGKARGFPPASSNVIGTTSL